MILTAKPLTKANFLPFGDVIEVTKNTEKKSINYGLTQRYNALANIDVTEDMGAGIISVFRSTPKNESQNNLTSGQVIIDCMERHPLSSQAFYPLSAKPYLVVVAPSGVFDVTKIQVFLSQQNQGVNYHKGTWHHYCLALQQVSDFLVIDRQGSGKNCDEVSLPNPIFINYDLNNKSDLS